MKITVSHLRRIIKEEVNRLYEIGFDLPPGASGDGSGRKSPKRKRTGFNLPGDDNSSDSSQISFDDEPISGRISPDMLSKYASKIAADAGYKKVSKPKNSGENMLYSNPRMRIKDMEGTIEFVESQGKEMFIPHPNNNSKLEDLGFDPAKGLSLDPPAEVKPAGSWGGLSLDPLESVPADRVGAMFTTYQQEKNKRTAKRALVKFPVGKGYPKSMTDDYIEGIVVESQWDTLFYPGRSHSIGDADLEKLESKGHELFSEEGDFYGFDLPENPQEQGFEVEYLD
jgi:hypothetical protein